MKKAILYFACSFIYLSCKKDVKEVVTVTPATRSTTVQLNIEQVINDSTIVLNWSKFSGSGFQKYRLMRNATYLKNGQFTVFAEPVDSSNDVNHLRFTENKLPLARDIYYYLLVSKDTTTFNQGFQQVAYVSYQRPNSLFYGTPTDVLFDKQQQRLYITEQNKITQFSYATGRITGSKDFPPGIGYCSLGTFNGSNELYVPTNDGWIQILDPATLQLKDRIYVAGYGIGSVVAVNEKLFVSSSDMSQSGYSNCIKVYERSTKNLIGRTGFWDKTRLLPLEGSPNELVELTINLAPTDLSYYQFTTAGVPVVKKHDTYHGDYHMDAGIMRSFPDGSKLITSSSGTIFNKSLVFDRYVKHFGGYSDFAFGTSSSLIYAGYANQKKVDLIAYPSMTTSTSYTTAFYPYKIFVNGNTLVSVSKVSTSQQMTFLFIEKINL